MKQNNIIIGIDTSCYTTSIAAISLEKSIILNEKIIHNKIWENIKLTKKANKNILIL